MNSEIKFEVIHDDMHVIVRIAAGYKPDDLPIMLEHHARHAIRQLSGELQELRDQNIELQERIYEIARRTF